MSKRLILAATFITLSSIISTVSAWEPPSEGCVTVRNELGVALDLLQECKETYPQNEWDPECAGERAKFHACAELAVKRERGGICKDGDAVEQAEKGGICSCPPAPAEPPSIVGNWTMFVDVGCNGSGLTATINYHGDGTWNIGGYANNGSWTQDSCHIEMTDVSLTPNVIWSAIVWATITPGEYNLLSGKFTNGAGLNGCWTATSLPDSGASAAMIVEDPQSDGSNPNLFDE